jgi:hypothetical protein
MLPEHVFRWSAPRKCTGKRTYKWKIHIKGSYGKLRFRDYVSVEIEEANPRRNESKKKKQKKKKKKKKNKKKKDT